MEITGNVQDRFVQITALLYLMNPVRGEATEHGLDQDSNEIGSNPENVLKRKFLDSFALISSTKRDGDYVSAACLEEGFPEGTVVRVASNTGVNEHTMKALREIVAILNDVASGKYSPLDKQAEVLLKIIELDRVKIRFYIKDIHDIHDVLCQSQDKSLGSSNNGALKSFSDWVARSSRIRDLVTNPSSEDLVWLLTWALEAKRRHSEYLAAAFYTGHQRLRRVILKLARYPVASMSLLRLASEVPRLFNPMIVESVDPPPKKEYSIPEGQFPLKSVLKRLNLCGKEEEFVTHLRKIWSTADPESYFRNACSLNLTVHAEIQLLNFYDSNPDRAPSFRFVGVSKKTCFLCEHFLASHPQLLSVSSYHRKLYPAWRTQPTSKNYKVYKEMIKSLSIRMEAMAQRDLKTRVRRLVPPDSTDGVSLAGLTDFATDVIRGNFAIAEKEDINTTESVSTQAIEVVDLSSENESSYGMVEMVASLNETVLHFQRANNAERQDIIILGEIADPNSKKPSWPKLLELLKDSNGVAFQENEEYLMVNGRIKVANERQFNACMQHLKNAETRNAEVFVCSKSRLAVPR